jgi:hypothetical protein
LPNADGLINGVRFLPHKLGVISEDISEEVAAEFLKIDGYIKSVLTKAELQDAATAATAAAAAAVAAAADATSDQAVPVVADAATK